MSGNPLVRFDEGRVGRTFGCRPLSYSTGSFFQNGSGLRHAKKQFRMRTKIEPQRHEDRKKTVNRSPVRPALGAAQK